MRASFGGCMALFGLAGCPSFAQTVQFDFGGTITSAFALVGPSYMVGDPFASVARFNANAPDYDSRPDFGRYLVSSWTVQNETWTLDDWPTWLEIFDGTTSNDRFRIYRGISINSYWNTAELEVTFPPTSFVSDALPASLDLNAALGRQFTHSAGDPAWLGLEFRYTASITTFTATIPDPAATQLLILASAGFRRQRVRPVGSSAPSP